MNIFDVLAIAMMLCAIPIGRLLTRSQRSRSTTMRGLHRRGDDVFGAVMWLGVALTLDFLDSLPGVGLGTKTALGQDVLEPLSHLVIVGVLVWGLWRSQEIRTGAVVAMVAIGFVGFVCSTLVEQETARHLANGLMPAFSWLVTALCVVTMVRIAWPDGRDQFEILLFIGVLALGAMVAQNELIIQWAEGNAHYPDLAPTEVIQPQP